MPMRFAKTDAGREEIRQGRYKLSRSMRNLLLLVDESRPAEQWLQLVHGATDADLQHLVAQGLVAPHADLTSAPMPLAGRVPASLADALAQLSYDQLYTLLTSQARDRLGLIAGYRFVLEVEKAGGVEDLRKLAERFLSLVKQHQGEAAERQMRVVLCMAA